MVDFPTGVANTTPTFLIGGDEGSSQPAKLPVTAAGRALVSAADANAQRALIGAGLTVETPTGSINGTNRIFTLTAAPINGAALVFMSGAYVPPSMYSISGVTLTFGLGNEPDTGDTLTVAYGSAIVGGGGGAVASVNGQTGAVTLTAADVSAVPSSEKAAANGVATLDASGQVPASQLINANNQAVAAAIIFG